MNTIRAIAVLACVFLSPIAHATQYHVTPFDQDFVFRFPLHIWEVLQPTPENKVEHTNETFTDLEPGSTIIIRYTSELPVPIRFAAFPKDSSTVSFQAHDYLIAVLPADKEGEAFLPLTTTNRWTPGKQGMFITVYGLQDSMPVINAVGIGDLQPVSSLSIALKQIFLPEFLRFDSTNFLEGYKAFNISFVPMLGVVFLVVCGLLLAFKRSRIILVACFVFLLLYQSRFLIDIVPATTKDVTDWKQDRTVPSFGNLVGVAEFLNKESEEYSGEIRIAMCGTLVTPLRYFIHPIQIEGDEWFPTATHGVLLGGWMQDGDTFICKNQSRKGELLHSFPDGSAVVRFFSES